MSTKKEIDDYIQEKKEALEIRASNIKIALFFMYIVVVGYHLFYLKDSKDFIAYKKELTHIAIVVSCYMMLVTALFLWATIMFLNYENLKLLKRTNDFRIYKRFMDAIQWSFYLLLFGIFNMFIPGNDEVYVRLATSILLVLMIHTGYYIYISVDIFRVVINWVDGVKND